MGHYRHLWNLFVTFLVSGIWHGANLTFVLWGSLHGLYQIVGIEKNRLLPKVNVSKRLHAVFNCLVTFVLVMFAWIFFRANDLHSAFSIIANILMLKEIKDEMSIKVHALNSKNYWVRIIFISLFIAFIILTASFNGGAFIYFQF